MTRIGGATRIAILRSTWDEVGDDRASIVASGVASLLWLRVAVLVALSCAEIAPVIERRTGPCGAAVRGPDHREAAAEQG